MLGFIEGKIIARKENSIVINTGSVGYKISVTLDTLYEINKKPDKVSLFTYLAVRETALDLYGFLSQDDLEFFELLITVSGIGPKTALTILNVATIPTLKSAISYDDPSRLTKISGIGKKTAEKIVHELKDKVIADESHTMEHAQSDSDTIETLKTLGYGEREAREVLKKIDKNLSSTSDRVKQALKILGK